MTWIDLNKIPKKILFVTNLIVIILLITAIFFLFTEIHYVKKYGGSCMNNPVAWAEQYAREEKGIIINCHCERVWNGYIPELNITGGIK